MYAANKKLRVGYALVGGQPEAHPEAIFAPRYEDGGKRRWKKVGKDPAKAITALLRQEHIERGREMGLPTVGDTQSITASGDKREISTAIKNYLDALEIRTKRRTLNAYTKALAFFSDTVDVQYLEDLRREHVLRYLAAIHLTRVSSRTIANRLGYVQTFLHVHKLDGLLVAKDRPKYTKRAPNAYNKEFLRTLFAACSDEQRILFEFFLHSGCREQEVMHACWPDIDPARKILSVREKPDLDWTLKDYEERTIPLSSEIVAKLKARRKSRPDDRLIFPTRDGKPDGHFLRTLKIAALRAGLNCGHCRNKNRLSCAKHPVCKHVDLVSSKYSCGALIELE
ncbi:MAG TPA: site-specific integrase [Bryobacteraceae bacterium]|nr:site-specific integrase [Bryobacteraceae bacterium]